MVREAIEQASREELIELTLATHAVAEQEKNRAEEEKARRLEAERQLAWFKKQLFGAKSEKRPGPIAEVSQLSLGEVVSGEPQTGEKSITVKTYARAVSKTDRKSTRLNSSHVKISYAVFCLKKKKK